MEETVNSFMDELPPEEHAYFCPAPESRPFRSRFIQLSLLKTPPTLMGLVDLLKEKADIYDLGILFWVTANSFIAPYEGWVNHEEDAFESNFTLNIEFWKSTLRCGPLTVCSETETGVLSILKILFDLSDDDYSEIHIQSFGRPFHFLETNDNLLEALLDQNNPNRKIRFTNFEFRPRDCSVLATSGRATNLRFRLCTFEDNGASFAEAIRTRVDESVGPAKLEFWRTYPGDFLLHWDRYSAIELVFNEIKFSIPQFHDLASAEIRHVKLLFCTSEGASSGQALVDFARADRGPRGLSLYGYNSLKPFDTERFLSFLAALQGNQHLEFLQFNCHRGHGHGCAAVLADALRHNKVLTHLGCIIHDFVDRDSWISLFDAISTHPALRTLMLGRMKQEQGIDLTQAMLEMTQKNNILEKIDYSNTPFIESCPSMINHKVFRLRVVPKLECNRLRKQLLKVQDIKVQSTRAGIVAGALARLNDKAWLTYMVLHQNIDILVMSTDESPLAVGNDRVVRSSRKRNHCDLQTIDRIIE